MHRPTKAPDEAASEARRDSEKSAFESFRMCEKKARRMAGLVMPW